MKNQKEVTEQVQEGKKFEHSAENSEKMRFVKLQYYNWYILILKHEIKTNGRLKESYGYAMNLEYYDAFSALYPSRIGDFELKFESEIFHKTSAFLQMKGLQNLQSWDKAKYKKEQKFLCLLEISNYNPFKVLDRKK